MNDLEDEYKKAKAEYAVVYVNSLKETEIHFDIDLRLKLESIVAEDGKSNVSAKDIVDALGINYTQYSNDINSGNVPIKYIVSLCLRKNININWVLLNSQPMWKQEKATEAIERYYLCRLKKPKKIINIVTRECEKYVRFIRYISSESGIVVYAKDKDGLDHKGFKKKAQDEKYIYDKTKDIFSFYYKKEKNYFNKIVKTVLFFSLSFYIGYLYGEFANSIPEYKRKIQILVEEKDALENRLKTIHDTSRIKNNGNLNKVDLIKK